MNLSCDGHGKNLVSGVIGRDLNGTTRANEMMCGAYLDERRGVLLMVVAAKLMRVIDREGKLVNSKKLLFLSCAGNFQIEG